MIIVDTSLTTLSGLGALARVSRSVTILRNPALVSLDLTSLERAHCGLWVIENPQLARLGALAALRDLFGACPPSSGASLLAIIDNPALQSLEGLEALQRAGVVNIDGNDSLTSLAGLGDVSIPIGALAIANNPSLQTLAPLRIVIEPDAAIASVSIVNNDALTELAGLEAITSLSYGIGVVDNESLHDISALDGLERVGDIVGFIDNRALSRCQVERLLARLQDNGFDGVLENDGNLDPPVCP